MPGRLKMVTSCRECEISRQKLPWTESWTSLRIMYHAILRSIRVFRDTFPELVDVPNIQKYELGKKSESLVNLLVELQKSHSLKTMVFYILQDRARQTSIGNNERPADLNHRSVRYV